MKRINLPSVSHIFQSLFQTLKRFPLASISAIVGTIAAICLTDIAYGDREDYSYLTNILVTASLGLPLGLAVSLFWEQKSKNYVWLTIASAVFFGLALLYYYSLPEELGWKDWTFFALLNLAFHLLVAFAPFIFKNQPNAFWQFNKNLFLRFLTAALYSAVLYCGLALALAALEQLFGFDINEKFYLKLWVFLAGIFNTIFFLAGVPKDINELETDSSYPKGLKVFTQYVLLPLVAIYLVILYFYTGKIILEWSWPQGWVSYLILGFSVVGILSFLLVWPLRNEKENQWINVYAKWFYILLLPLIVVLALGVYRRVSEYGITENRYFLIILAVWLLAMVLHFIFRGNKSVKIIPVSLCLFALFSSFGPWGAFNVSKMSQENRLKSLLSESGLLKDGKIVPGDNSIDFTNRKNISSIVDFFSERQELNVLDDYFEKDLNVELDSVTDYYKPEKITEMMGFKFVHEWETVENLQHSYFNLSTYSRSKNITEFDHQLTIMMGEHELERNKDSLQAYFDNEKEILQLYRNDSIFAEIDPVSFIETLLKPNTSNQTLDLPASQLRLTKQFPWGTVEIDMTNLNGAKEDGKLDIHYINGFVYLAFDK